MLPTISIQNSDLFVDGAPTLPLVQAPNSATTPTASFASHMNTDAGSALGESGAGGEGLPLTGNELPLPFQDPDVIVAGQDVTRAGWPKPTPEDGVLSIPPARSMALVGLSESTTTPSIDADRIGGRSTTPTEPPALRQPTTSDPASHTLTARLPTPHSTTQSDLYSGAVLHAGPAGNRNGTTPVLPGMADSRSEDIQPLGRATTEHRDIHPDQLRDRLIPELRSLPQKESLDRPHVQLSSRSYMTQFAPQHRSSQSMTGLPHVVIDSSNTGSLIQSMQVQSTHVQSTQAQLTALQPYTPDKFSAPSSSRQRLSQLSDFEKFSRMAHDDFQHSLRPTVSANSANSAAPASPTSASAALEQAPIALQVRTDTAQAQLGRVLDQPISTPVGESGWDKLVAERVLVLAANNKRGAEIRLTPAELGPLRVELNIDDKAANVSFHAQHAITREALEQALPRLREMLAEQGMTLNHASVGSENEDGVRHGARNNAGEDQGSPQSANSDADAVEDSQTETRNPVKSALVDTFV